LHGGGNFGDLWRIHQDFRLDILRQYPNNKIIIFPQTVHYDSKQLLSEDASIMAKHKNLTVCARDRMSYDILKQHFSNNILLVPDMAFYIDMREWKKYIKPVIAGKLLFLRRTDHELDRNQKYDSVSVNAEVHDWPTMETPAFIVRLFYKIQRLFYLIDEVLHTSFKNLFSDFVFQRILCKYNIRKGIEFISKYETVYTTRLHAGILAFMLDKPVTFFDNSYGKNRGVYDAWLKNVETIKFTGK
jgi:pyruvyl transferase EpsO